MFFITLTAKGLNNGMAGGWGRNFKPSKRLAYLRNIHLNSEPKVGLFFNGVNTPFTQNLAIKPFSDEYSLPTIYVAELSTTIDSNVEKKLSILIICFPFFHTVAKFLGLPTLL
ncbi:MAG: hypothetical protein EAY66_03765 [Sphingobacteriales bacterium]|nr:MAG: hypothetical protein EAY66_03765 [Sphingobacteriales bacterium]